MTGLGTTVDGRRALWPCYATISSGWGRRMMRVYIVPLAYLQIVAELPDRSRIAMRRPVGVTSVPAAIVLLVLSLALASAILFTMALHAEEWKGVNYILRIISTNKGVASLSQAPIMLWTLVVAGASIYVMVLSGKQWYTLTLFGIAGGVSVLDRLTTIGDTTTEPAPPAADAGPGVKSTGPGGDADAARPPGNMPPRQDPIPDKPQAVGTPTWDQLSKSGDATEDMEIDVTHVQMLVFTLITAIFVAVKVAASYEIPEIPQNFLLLMGISNGVYVAAKHVGAKTSTSTNTRASAKNETK
jgi:hypothetical protein